MTYRKFKHKYPLLISELKNARNVKKDSNHRYIKLATKNLIAFYHRPEIKENQEFLYERYTVLEHRTTLMPTLFLPLYIGVIIPQLIIYSFKAFPDLTENTVNLIQTMGQPATPFFLQLLAAATVFLAVSAILFVVYMTFKLFKQVFYALLRTPDETITQNEIQIIRQLLTQQDILL